MCMWDWETEWVNVCVERSLWLNLNTIKKSFRQFHKIYLVTYLNLIRNAFFIEWSRDIVQQLMNRKCSILIGSQFQRRKDVSDDFQRHHRFIYQQFPIKRTWLAYAMTVRYLETECGYGFSLFFFYVSTTLDFRSVYLEIINTFTDRCIDFITFNDPLNWIRYGALVNKKHQQQQQ